jgi:hypothetical protein
MFAAKVAWRQAAATAAGYRTTRDNGMAAAAGAWLVNWRRGTVATDAWLNRNLATTTGVPSAHMT